MTAIAYVLCATLRNDNLDEMQQEFERLSLPCRLKAYRLACRLVGNGTDAEDVAQEALVAAWQHFRSYDRSRPFDAWLCRILANVAYKRRRHSLRMPTCSLDSAIEANLGGDSMAFEVPDKTADPEKRLLDPTFQEPLEIALASLPDVYRNAVWYAFIDGLSYRAIAQRMGCPIGTVRTRVHRGRALLRRRFEWELAARLGRDGVS
jgi:RNA polymerase sigma-70 factor (ECF subfamily)